MPGVDLTILFSGIERKAKIDAIQNMIDLGLTREQILRKYSPEEYEEALRSMPEKSIVRSTPGTNLKPPV